MKKATLFVTCIVLLAASSLNAAVYSETCHLNKSADGMDVAGLSAQATFVWDSADGDALHIVLTNTSTSVPGGFGNADQILTSLSFDLGGIRILGGWAKIAAGGYSVNFDHVPAQLVGPADISGEWGYANGGGGSSPLLTNIISTINAHQMARMGGGNLDGPTNLDGPEAGLVTTPALVSLGGLGVVAGDVEFDLRLSGNLSGLGFLDGEKAVVAEFGSDAAFVTVPEPATMSLLVLGGIGTLLRRRHGGGVA